VEDGRRILSNVVASQVRDHARFGGVVPEIASRKHLQNIGYVARAALEEAEVALSEIGAVAVTAGPGLVGALLVGISYAKGLCYAKGLPLVACDHIEGHIYAHMVAGGEGLRFPAVALVVSGGHTNLYLLEGHGRYTRLGQTRDDAAGEAFDKVAKVLGLGYPGGPAIDRLARRGNARAIAFPRTYLERETLDFSFSGIKTAVWYYVKRNGVDLRDQAQVADIAASFQEAVVEVLATKTLRAARKYGVARVYLCGGVACNRRLRELLVEEARGCGVEVHVPSPILCTDNAAMIASLGFFRFQAGEQADYGLNAYSVLP